LLVALKYHPDRNPGREAECNSKFQAISSANEILKDPQQRAKYDAHRIRAGLLHTYAATSSPPTRPPVPSRPPATGFSNFPPPPRPPPPPIPKSTFPTPPSGAQKYSNVRFSRPETTTSWGTSGGDDTKAKTNDYKAWEQMRPRHGQGPIPPARAVPPKPSTSSTFQPGREPAGATSAGTTPRRSGWDRWQDSQAGMAGMGKGSTNRPSPNRPRFAPGTPGGDEPQAQASAYFNVSSKGDRPTNSRSQTHMPPPRSPVPTAKKPDPLQAFREHVGINGPFGKKKPRAGPQFQKGHTEASNFNLSPNSLHRSATSAAPRSSNSRTRFYETQAASGIASHVRATSASSNHQSTSPSGKKDTRMPGMYTDSSSSASSSEDDTQATKTQIPQVKKRQPPAPTGTQAPHGTQPLRGFNLYAQAGDEKMAPQASNGGGGYSSIRRHSAVDLGTDKPPEGFQEHRMKRDAELQQQSKGEPHTPSSPASHGLQPPLARSYSWQEKADHRAKWGSPPKDKDSRPGTSEQAGNPPMYESQGYNPFSSSPSCGLHSPATPLDKWSDQWPFMSPKRPRAATAEPPPYWAIPSILPPPKESKIRKTAHTYVASRFEISKASQADHDSFANSFEIPTYTRKAPPGVSPLRTQSSDRIDTRFSPDDWHGRFSEAPSPNRIFTPPRERSPTKDSKQQEASTNMFNIHEDPSTIPQATAPQPPPPPPPPPTGQDRYYEERWVPHLNDIKFDIPQGDQVRSPIRANTRKRTRPRGPKLATAQPSVEDEDDEPTASSAAGESLEGSKANSDTDAMDIDEPTPPKPYEPEKSGSTALPNGVTHKHRRAPTLPPRMNGYGQPEAGVAQFNLGDLKNVAPFAPSNEGLGNMNDMVTNLPFESRPSPTKPSTDGPLQRLNLPQPPICPGNPQSLTGSSCERHGQRIRHYMAEWNKFNTKMTSILTAKTTSLHDSSGCDWFNIHDSGYDDYMKGLVELRRARVHYDTACDHHEKSMQDLGLLRQEMKRGRGGFP